MLLAGYATYYFADVVLRSSKEQNRKQTGLHQDYNTGCSVSLNLQETCSHPPPKCFTQALRTCHANGTGYGDMTCCCEKAQDFIGSSAYYVMYLAALSTFSWMEQEWKFHRSCGRLCRFHTHLSMKPWGTLTQKWAKARMSKCCHLKRLKKPLMLHVLVPE